MIALIQCGYPKFLATISAYPNYTIQTDREGSKQTDQYLDSEGNSIAKKVFTPFSHASMPEYFIYKKEV